MRSVADTCIIEKRVQMALALELQRQAAGNPSHLTPEGTCGLAQSELWDRPDKVLELSQSYRHFAHA